MAHKIASAQVSSLSYLSQETLPKDPAVCFLSVNQTLKAHRYERTKAPALVGISNAKIYKIMTGNVLGSASCVQRGSDRNLEVLVEENGFFHRYASDSVEP